MLESIFKFFKRFPPICFTYRFEETGYRKPMAKDLFLLLDAIHLPLCRPEFCPSGETTHCNQYVAEVCEIYGFKGLDGMLANQIISTIATNPQWSEVPMDRCQELANGGTLVIAGFMDEPHGHVNVICPGKPKNSGRWGTVPSCANVGKTNSIGKGINWSFSTMPRFWAWRATL